VYVEISNLVHRLIVTSPSLPLTNCPWKGRGYVTWPIFTTQLYAKRGIYRRHVSLCLSVTLRIVSKRLSVGSHKSCHTIVPRLVFWCRSLDHGKIQTGLPPVCKCKWGGVKLANFIVRPTYKSDIEHRQHRSKLEHRRIAISKSPIPMFLKICMPTMYFFTELQWIIMLYSENTPVQTNTIVIHHRYPRKTNMM